MLGSSRQQDLPLRLALSDLNTTARGRHTSTKEKKEKIHFTINVKGFISDVAEIEPGSRLKKQHYRYVDMIAA